MDIFCVIVFAFANLSCLFLLALWLLLGKRLPLGFLVFGVFLCFCHFVNS